MSTKIERAKLRESRGEEYLKRRAEIYQKFTKTRLERWPKYRKRFMNLIDRGIIIPKRYLKKYNLLSYKGDNSQPENLNAPKAI